MDWTTTNYYESQHSDPTAAAPFDLDFDLQDFQEDFREDFQEDLLSRDSSSVGSLSDSGSLAALGEDELADLHTTLPPFFTAASSSLTHSSSALALAFLPEVSATTTGKGASPLFYGAANPEPRPEVKSHCLSRLLEIQTKLSLDLQENPSYLERVKVQSRQLKRKMRQIRKQIDTMSPRKCKKEL